MIFGILNNEWWKLKKKEKTVASRLYLSSQLKCANVAQADLLSFYVTCIRQVMEYACQVVHNSLLAYLSDELKNFSGALYGLFTRTYVMQQLLRNQNLLRFT